MTETCGSYAGDRLDLDLPEDKRGSCGRPFDGIEVRVVDPVVGGRGGRAGSPARSASAAATSCGRSVAGHAEDTFDGDGFYPTGDLGRLDGDGYLWFDGRADDMFKVKGATVYPAEVERAVRAVDGVRQAHVTDVADRRRPARGRRPRGVDPAARRAGDRGADAPERVQGPDLVGRDELDRRRAHDGDVEGGQGGAAAPAAPRRDAGRPDPFDTHKGAWGMTRAIDCLVNVDFGDREMPDWMTRVKEDYFGNGFTFTSPELPELIDELDAQGVEKAILMTQVGNTKGRVFDFVEARPDRFSLGVGGLQPASPDGDAERARRLREEPPGGVRVGGSELLGRGHVQPHELGLLPALHQVLRARPAVVHEHRHPRSAAAGRPAEPDLHRPCLLPLPGAASCR